MSELRLHSASARAPPLLAEARSYGCTHRVRRRHCIGGVLTGVPLLDSRHERPER